MLVAMLLDLRKSLKHTRLQNKITTHISDEGIRLACWFGHALLTNPKDNTHLNNICSMAVYTFSKRQKLYTKYATIL